MGAANAEGMAWAVNDGMLGMRQAIAWHLSSNHFPPVPAIMVDVALAAIADPEGMVTLPAGVMFRDGRTEVEAWCIIDSLHLGAYVTDDDDDEGEWS